MPLVEPMSKYDVNVFRIDEDAILPKRKSKLAAGFDLHAIEDFTIRPGEMVIVGTGLVVQPPPGFHTEIFLRSSMAAKHSITLANGVGLIDRDFCGEEDEIKVILYRLPNTTNDAPVTFKKGTRIAQLVFRETHLFNIVEVNIAPGDTRGGLGSTGA